MSSRASLPLVRAHNFSVAHTYSEKPYTLSSPKSQIPPPPPQRWTLPRAGSPKIAPAPPPSPKSRVPSQISPSSSQHPASSSPKSHAPSQISPTPSAWSPGTLPTQLRRLVRRPSRLIVLEVAPPGAPSTPWSRLPHPRRLELRRRPGPASTTHAAWCTRDGGRLPHDVEAVLQSPLPSLGLGIQVCGLLLPMGTRPAMILLLPSSFLLLSC